MVTVVLSLLLAQTANPYLDEGRRLAKELKFAECIDQMKVASQVLDFSKAEKLEVLTLLGRCQIAEGQRTAAEESFAQLLSVAPEHELDPKESPKILEVFAVVKKRLYAPDFVQLSPQPARAGQAIFRLVDPWHRVDSVVVVRRLDAATREQRLESGARRLWQRPPAPGLFGAADRHRARGGGHPNAAAPAGAVLGGGRYRGRGLCGGRGAPGRVGVLRGAGEGQDAPSRRLE